MAELIVVASCNSVPEAHILRGVLESAEIPAMLHNEHLVNAQWLYAGAVGGVELVVPAAFAEEAVRVLRGDSSSSEQCPSTEGHKTDDAPDNLSDPATTDEEPPPLFEETPVCPACGGQRVPRRLRGVLTALTLYIGIPLPGTKNHWRCKDCGKTF